MSGPVGKDRHHIFWPRSVYRDHYLLYELRTRSGLIVKLGREAHNALHRDIAPPPTPTIELAADILDYLDDTSPSNEVLATHYFLEQEASNLNFTSENREYYQRLATHITRQLVYLEVGEYEPIQQTMGG